MERLLVVKAQAIDCEAEVLLNDIPVARVDAGRSNVVVPVHEYALEGDNVLDLVLWPHPAQALQQTTLPAQAPFVSTGKHAAHARVLLPRIGNAAHEDGARTLAQVDWAPDAGVSCELPLKQSLRFQLPASFPRWRWLDAPPVEPSPEMRQLALAFVQDLAQRLAAGDIDAFLQATRLRSDELAVAYQQDVAQLRVRLHAYLTDAGAGGRFNWLPMEDEVFVLRHVAQGRLLECLDIGGGPMLRTAPDDTGRALALPLRLAAVAGKFYVLR